MWRGEGRFGNNSKSVSKGGMWGGSVGIIKVSSFGPMGGNIYVGTRVGGRKGGGERGG